ncbi:MAG: SpoIIE family protein phosphatase [Firmicutes bacterium]|nr:SpoIIE family protein phosphatase [Bacillota bacterium]
MLGGALGTTDIRKSARPLRPMPRYTAWTAVGLSGAVLGQAMIYRHAAPFVIVFSLLIWQRRRAWYAPLMLGGLVGTAVGIGWLPAALLLCWALLVPLPWRRPAFIPLRWPLVALGAGGIFGVGSPWSSYHLIIMAFVAAGAVLLYGLLSRELERAIAGEVDQRTLVLAMASAGCFVAGLAGYQIGEVKPSLVFGGLVMLCATVLQGPAGGAVAGATLGVTLSLRGSVPYDWVGILVAGGFAAGWLGEKSWRLASLGLVAGILVYAVFIRLPHPLEPFWVSLAVAALAFQAIPASVIDIGRDWARTLGRPGPQEQLGQQMLKIAEVMREMARAFRVEDETQAPETALVESVVTAVCQKCSLYPACWEDEFYRSYRSLIDLSLKAEAGPVAGEDMSGDLARRCIRPDAVAAEANRAMAREKERMRVHHRLKESRELAQRQLEGLGELVSAMAEDVQRERTARATVWRRPPLGYRVGVAKRPRRGGTVSGDSELISEIDRTRVVFGISDGMGVGPRAAWESGTAMSLLEQLLVAGFSESLAVHAVNTTLLLRSTEEQFATLDILVLDRERREMEMVKVAALPTFIKRGRRVWTVRGKGLPVGIVPQVTIDPIHLTAEPGDVLVMVTDGVMDPDLPESEERLKEFLRQMPHGDAEWLAEAVLSYMLGDSQDGRDDALAMVIVLGPTSERQVDREMPEDSPVREWKRVTATPVKGTARRPG